MKIFFLTFAACLLAGAGPYHFFRHKLADSPVATTAQRAPASDPRRPARVAGSTLAEIPEADVPGRANAMLHQCMAGRAKWSAQLLPLWLRWAQFAPEEALRHVASARASFTAIDQSSAEDRILAVWASHNAKAAADWVRKRAVPTVSGLDEINHTAYVTEQAYPALMGTLALRDFPAAFSLIPHAFAKRALREKSSDYSQPWMPVFYAAALTDANRPGFLQSLRALADADLRGRMCADVIQHLLEEQTPNRREVIAQLPLPDLWPKGVLSPWASIAYDEVKASSDPEKPASEIMARLRPDDPGRSLVLEWIMVAWADRDPAAAGRWLQTWNEDPAARNARRAYSNITSRNDPVTAFTWIAESGDARPTANAAKLAYLHQYKQNPAGARDWLTNQNLPPALESLLLGQGKAE